jgi:probable rRNA maturation factor
VVNLFYEETEVLGLDPDFFVLWLSDVCKKHNRNLGEINLIFCSDEYLLQINKEHLDHDYYTDIITFDYYEENISGDLFISVDRVKENAKDLKIEFTQELHRVVVHGTLHLLAFGDKTKDEEVLMRKLEDEALLLIVPRET